jgi:3,4-dihydroxy 2-butanone 4-phosphate synthase/GTP cyclohydrolase II
VAAGDGSAILDRVKSVLQRRRRSAHLDRPPITLTYAQSLDGCIATETGRPTQISNRQTQVLAHQLRPLHDGILVGVTTVLVDNPQLTTRHAPGSHPRPIIVDSRLRTPLDANLIRREDHSVIIATTERASAEQAALLTAAGATVIRLPATDDDLVDLVALFKCLPELGVNSVMIEGGAQLITSILKARLADQLVLTIAPRFLGGVHAVGSMQQIKPALRPMLKNVCFECLQGDLVAHGEFDWAPK